MGDWLHGYRYSRILQRRITRTANFGPFAQGAFNDLVIQSAERGFNLPTPLPDVITEQAQFDSAAIVLIVNAATRAGGETYDIFVTGGLKQVVEHTGGSDSKIGLGNGTAASGTPLRWDIVHFPQIASVITLGTPKIFMARVNGIILPQNVTNANPGVPANEPSILDISAPGAGSGIKTLGAGLVRHGYWGDHVTHELVLGGGGSPSIDYELWFCVAAT